MLALDRRKGFPDAPDPRARVLAFVAATIRQPELHRIQQPVVQTGCSQRPVLAEV
jgi:hypothetical protein